MLTIHFDQIIGSFQRSINRIEVKSNIPLFKNLQGFVSLNALAHMVKEFERSKSGVGYDKGRCRCIQRKTHLLPCACEIGIFHASGNSIPLNAVDDHWKHLSLDAVDDKSTKDKSSTCDISYQFDAIQARFNKVSEEEKYLIQRQLNEIAFPSTSSMVPPKSKVKTKGAPKKKKQKFFDAKRDPSGWEHVDEKVRLSEESGASNLKSSQRSSKNTPQRASKLSQAASRVLTQTAETKIHLPFLPPHVHSYVQKIVDVQGDGNCGFRAVGLGLDMGEDSWPLIRQDLIQETKERQTVYENMFGKDRLLELRKALTIEFHGRQPPSKWFDLPEMGYMVATKYNVALVQFSLTMNYTYLPLRGNYGSSKFKIISVMNKENVHWLHLSISPTCPLPPIAPQWYHHYSPESASWLHPYTGRLTLWQSMCPPSVRPSTTGDAPRCVDLADDSIDDL